MSDITEEEKEIQVEKEEEEEITNVEDAVNEYYKLKRTFENNVEADKKEIWAKDASKKEKRKLFLKLQPKCVNCNKPSKVGTFFTTERIHKDDDESSYRRLKCHCGHLINPCGLNIEIHLGNHELLSSMIHAIQDDMDFEKKSIIEDKNQLLFGLITTEQALNLFDYSKKIINEYTNLYGKYIELLNKLVDNPEKQQELKEAMIEYYQYIRQIKEAMQKMKQTDNTSFANDVASMYVSQMKPLLDKIRHLKYSTTSVYMDESTNQCRLIQIPYMFDAINVATDNPDKLVAFSKSLQARSHSAIHISIGSQKSPNAGTLGTPDFIENLMKRSDIPENPDIPKNPGSPKYSEIPDNPDIPKNPENPENPEIPEIPGSPDYSENDDDSDYYD